MGIEETGPRRPLFLQKEILRLEQEIDELEQMVNRKKPAPWPASVPKPAKPAIAEAPAQKSRLKQFLDLFKFRR